VGPMKKTCRNFVISAYQRIIGQDFHPENPEVTRSEVTSSENERRKVKLHLSGLQEGKVSRLNIQTREGARGERC
jgi:hypothetical protein